jgi:uncharacterized phage-associated protein
MSAKFKALVHHVVATCGDPQRLGATRLNKICWYVDTLSFRVAARPVTDETYVKRQHGPVPRSILRVIRELEGEQKIHVRDHHYLPGRKMRIFVALEDADVSIFAPTELEIIDFVIKHVCNNHSAASISELSHDVIWEAANEGEEIPLAATLVAHPAELRGEIKAWADRAIDKAEAAKRAASA